jgi:hypothetical protein
LAVAQAEVDEEAAARWKENEARRQQLEEEKRVEVAKEAAKMAQREGYVSRLLGDEDERRRSAMKLATEKFESFAKKISKTFLARDAIRQKTDRIVGDYRIGNGTRSGLPEPISRSNAKKMALGEWVEENAAQSMEPVEKEWDARRKNLEVRKEKPVVLSAF